MTRTTLMTVTGTIRTTCACGTPAEGLGEAPVNADGTIAVERATPRWPVLCDACRRAELTSAGKPGLKLTEPT